MWLSLNWLWSFSSLNSPTFHVHYLFIYIYFWYVGGVRCKRRVAILCKKICYVLLEIRKSTRKISSTWVLTQHLGQSNFIRKLFTIFFSRTYLLMSYFLLNAFFDIRNDHARNKNTIGLYVIREDETYDFVVTKCECKFTTMQRNTKLVIINPSHFPISSVKCFKHFRSWFQFVSTEHWKVHLLDLKGFWKWSNFRRRILTNN